jgi:adenosylcobinamide kinase/adenosylcobinamide-phosphate guanylyltransferase
MDITVLGTGSADGWPNPWCACLSCTWARSEKVLRESTCIVVNGSLLVDFGPASASQAERAGISLVGIDTVLITHAHFDHLAPQHLLTRSWTHTDRPLRIIGPASVMHAVEHWIGPDDPITCYPINAGDIIELDGDSNGTIIRALSSSHFDGSDALSADALLYDISVADGGRLLYATDTGPLPNACIEAVRDATFDIAFIEQTFGHYTDHNTGHLDLATFPIELDRLRAVKAITPDTTVIAVHLSHHNPPGDALSEQLAEWGAQIVADGTHLTIDTTLGGARSLTMRRTSDADPSIQTTAVLITGGARSGKSSRAESLLADVQEVRYIATSGTRPNDVEWQQRITLHQNRRPTTWLTIETLDLSGELLKDDSRPILIDCLSLWLAGIMDQHQVWQTTSGTPERQSALAAIEAAITALTDAIRTADCDTVIVTNEVGSGIVPEHESGRLFRDLLGRLNAQAATACDRVELVVAGRVITL